MEDGETLPKIAVVIATLGRPDIAGRTIRHLLENQILKPSAMIVSCVTAEDAGEAASISEVQVITGPKGLPAQRNTALAVIPDDISIVVFFDDDFVADCDWLLEAARMFRDQPDVAGYTGHVLADGIKGPGLGFEEALSIVGESRGHEVDWSVIEPFSPYGCNMAFRASAIGDLRFDERLVLYGWLEDRDFAAALAQKGGRFIKCSASRGVHMGVKGGRVAGDRLGYSQIVNPFYMLRKGTMTTSQVVDHVFRNLASNIVLSLRPEPYVDRRGRLRGNLRGLGDLLAGRLQPERAASLDTVSTR